MSLGSIEMPYEKQQSLDIVANGIFLNYHNQTIVRHHGKGIVRHVNYLQIDVSTKQIRK